MVEFFVVVANLPRNLTAYGRRFVNLSKVAYNSCTCVSF